MFLHGLTADHTLFYRQIEYFRKNWNVLCWDAPAHGKSRPYKDFSYANAIEELKAILNQEKIRRAVFVGQSMGGYMSQTFLKKNPDMVDAFIAVDSCPFGYGYYSKTDMWWLRQVEWMAYLYPHKILVHAIAKMCSYTDAACQNMLTALQPYTKKELCHLMGIGYAGFLEENCDLKIECPVLILYGENDRTGKVKQYCNAWSERTGYPLYVIPNAAHNANVDNYERVNEVIERFINEIRQKQQKGDFL